MSPGGRPTGQSLESAPGRVPARSTSLQTVTNGLVKSATLATRGRKPGTGEPVRTFQRPKDRRSRPQRRAVAVEQQAEYEA